jgi:hypothetical protein
VASVKDDDALIRAKLAIAEKVVVIVVVIVVVVVVVAVAVVVVVVVVVVVQWDQLACCITSCLRRNTHLL